MRRVLLDTSAYSAFMRGSEASAALVREADEIHVTPVVLGELRAGFRGGRYRRKNEDELSAFLDSPRVVVDAIDEDTSIRYAEIVASLRTAGRPVPANDVWIAASAMQHGLVVVTTDAHFSRIPTIIAEVV